MVCTARSASPLTCRSFWLDVTCVNEYSFENSSNSVETNFGPLSDMAKMDFNARIDFWDASSIDISLKRE